MDLGNLKSIRPGDPLAVVEIKGNTLTVCGGVTRFTKIHPRMPDRGMSGRGTFNLNTGKVSTFMYPNDYWVSANPAHISAAQENAEQSARKAQAEKEEQERLLEEFTGKLHTLMEEYGASICAVQTSGDDQGVEVEVEVSIGKASSLID